LIGKLGNNASKTVVDLFSDAPYGIEAAKEHATGTNA